jgi:hypothetical protein
LLALGFIKLSDSTCIYTVLHRRPNSHMVLSA